MDQATQQLVSLTTKNTASLTMGICSTVIGILALLFGWVPFLGLLAIPVAIIGVLLAGIGFLLALVRGFQGVGLPLLGGIISLAGAVLPILSTGGTAAAVGEAQSRVAEQRQIEQGREREEGERKVSYISEHVELYDVQASYQDSILDGRVPGVLFKLKNAGDSALDMVEVTVYFRDDSGEAIAEKKFYPVLVRSFSISPNDGPLKPGYVWQMEPGKFFSAKSVPSEWDEGSVEAKVTDIRFTEQK